SRPHRGLAAVRALWLSHHAECRRRDRLRALQRLVFSPLKVGGGRGTDTPASTAPHPYAGPRPQRAARNSTLPWVKTQPARRAVHPAVRTRRKIPSHRFPRSSRRLLTGAVAARSPP